ncbi:MAG: AmmeMemoRadiSam system protein B [Candidatus Heimdallarchaeota archaeon]|nr:AmmeMemoRadiSam system protein B [Candidatus Heimdallarchaeota archaeon]
MDRFSRHAGSWYAGTKASLESQIHELFLNKWGVGKDPLEFKNERTLEEDIIGIASPHAGYAYSGPIASHGYALLYDQFEKIDSAIVLGPNHSGFGAPISIYPEGAWNNPLGSISIDQELVAFAKSYSFDRLRNKIGFETSAHLNEHSIDIQLPFLQYLYKDTFEILPICLGDQSYNTTVAELSQFLSELLKAFSERKIIIIASSDLSHEHNYDLVVKNDQTMLSYLEKGDLNGAEQYRKHVSMTMCGFGPVFTLIRTAATFGKPIVKVLKYANSSDIHPGGGYTVGYASIAVSAN